MNLMVHSEINENAWSAATTNDPRRSTLDARPSTLDPRPTTLDTFTKEVLH